MKKNLIFTLLFVVVIRDIFASQSSFGRNNYGSDSCGIGSFSAFPRSSSPISPKSKDQISSEAIQSLRDLRYSRPTAFGTYVDQRQQQYWKEREQEIMIEKEVAKLKKKLYPKYTPEELAKVNLTPEQHKEAVRQAELEWY